jgi:hypothetical protein
VEYIAFSMFQCLSDGCLFIWLGALAYRKKFTTGSFVFVMVGERFFITRN